MRPPALSLHRLRDNRAALLLRFRRDMYFMVKIDFWLDNHNQPMNTSYNYTGYYAVQVNYQNSSASSAFGTH